MPDRELPLLPSMRFEGRLVAGAVLEDLDPVLVDRLRSPFSTHDRTQVLLSFGMAADAGDGRLQPTAAGVLFAGKHPERWVPHARIDAAVYQGDGEGLQQDHEVRPTARVVERAVFTGCLDRQILAACDFVRRNMRIEGNRGFGCTEVPQYDMAAVFEGVVNAVAHRDYTAELSVRIAMFDHRLEICSPGEPFLTSDFETYELHNGSRNVQICKLLSRCPVAGAPNTGVVRTTFMRCRGEGLELLRRRTERLAGKKAIHTRLGGSQVLLTIPAARAEAWATG